MSEQIEKISSFRDDYYYLSNFSPSFVTYDGIEYLSGEAAFQAQKCESRQYRRKFSLLPPDRARALGRQVHLRKDWEEVKDEIMYKIVRAKFEQSQSLLEKLLATGEAYLEEGNDWGDTYWGVTKDGGQNKLGHILMRVRSELREQSKF